ncbi:MAG: 16S rRNA (cytosine(1402)-N(4))-methyltransferase RsmH [Spirochaetes bacterium]|nr:16S rRNA (cytosine(1402)-N(4))-methyltransferase RsmH [Spirochaetota bacterium]
MNYLHSPVMVNEVIEYLIDDRTRYFLDCTAGEGGHSAEILKRFPAVTVFALDRDKEILEIARNRLSIFHDRFKAFNSNFINISLKDLNLEKPSIDSALMDLGISFYHYKNSTRGFSFSSSEKLNMTLDEESIDVYEIINNYNKDQLADIFFKYGEERFSRRIAGKIVKQRETKSIETSSELASIIASAVPYKSMSKRIHPATKCFQALRIFANKELENIKTGIPNILSLLKNGGKLGVITFHSLEDRTVKEIFKDLSKSCICPPGAPVCICNKKKEIELLSKALKPSMEEIKKNAASRSAKFRVVEKI